jgi:hypothetical protein
MPRNKGSKHSEETKAKISATMTGRSLPEAHKQAIKKGHSSNKESGSFYWSEEYKAKQSKPKPGCREAAFRQHHGRAYDEWLAQEAAKIEVYNKPVLIEPAIDRPDWLKDYI